MKQKKKPCFIDKYFVHGLAIGFGLMVTMWFLKALYMHGFFG